MRLLFDGPAPAPDGPASGRDGSIMAPSTDHTTHISSGVASPVTTEAGASLANGSKSSHGPASALDESASGSPDGPASDLRGPASGPASASGAGSTHGPASGPGFHHEPASGTTLVLPSADEPAWDPYGPPQDESASGLKKPASDLHGPALGPHASASGAGSTHGPASGPGLHRGPATSGPSNPIPGAFLELLVHSWSHFFGIYRQRLSNSSKIDF